MQQARCAATFRISNLRHWESCSSHQGLSLPGLQATRKYQVTKFIPFNPVDKKTTATVIGPDGKQMKTCKGAPQVHGQLCALILLAPLQTVSPSHLRWL